MTIIITKTKLALAILAVALIAPAAALASNIFADVDDGAFYAAPVEWAFNNNITTGKTATSFAPLDNVTRGESVTFLKRYNDNVVEPADTALQGEIDAAEADIASNTSDITALSSTTCSGRQTGFRVYDSTAFADNKDWFIDVQLPCVASAPLTSANVNFNVSAVASDDDATCSGTAAEPTAPFGKVCIYVSSSNGVDNLSGLDSLITETTTFDRRGFTIRGLSNTGSGGDIYARMTWAYTPPLTIILPPIVPPVLAPTANDGADLGATAK